MLVLEEWTDRTGFLERLVVTPFGNIIGQWFNHTTNRWEKDHKGWPVSVPLFAPTRKTRPTARAKSRPRKSRFG